MLLYLVVLLLAFQLYSTENGYDNYTPRNICMRLITNTTALIQWVEPLTFRAEIVGYKIYYTTKSNLSLNEWNTQIIGSNPLTTIKGIKLGENYHFRIQVRSLGLDGPGPLSEVYQFRAKQRARSCYDHPESDQIISPNVLRAAATSSNSVEVWWNLPYDTHYVTGFQIFYGTDKSNIMNKSVGIVQTTELPHLQENATYKIAIAAITNLGIEFYSQETTVKVRPQEVPLEVKTFDITNTTIIFEWKRPEKIKPLKYRISYRAEKDFTDSQGLHQHYQYENIEEVIDGSHSSNALLNLTPNTIYHINISAIPVDYSYRPAAKITATTEISAPSFVPKPDIMDVTKGRVNIILPQASEEYGPISHYYIVVVPQVETVELPSSVYTTEDLLGNEWGVGEEIDAPYIAAKFSSRIPYAFMLGTGDVVGEFRNYKLNSRKRYRLFMRAVVLTPEAELFTDSPYSDYFSLSERNYKHKV